MSFFCKLMALFLWWIQNLKLLNHYVIFEYYTANKYAEIFSGNQLCQCSKRLYIEDTYTHMLKDNNVKLSSHLSDSNLSPSYLTWCPFVNYFSFVACCSLCLPSLDFPDLPSLGSSSVNIVQMQYYFHCLIDKLYF